MTATQLKVQCISIFSVSVLVISLFSFSLFYCVTTFTSSFERSYRFLFHAHFKLDTNSMRISIHSLPILIAADPSLGRVDYSSLSDQTLMELLIDGFDAEEKQIFQSREGMYLDVCEWSCVSCDNNGRVVKIKDSHNNTPGGSLALSYVPPKVKEFDMSCKRSLVGSVELTNLPHGMKILSVSYNQITGSVNLTRLPDSMKYLCLDNNELTGSVDLANLPQSMRVLFLHKNQLTGSLDLTQLPQHVELVFLQDNQFTGSVDLAHLPAKTEGVYLTNNQLSG